MNEHEFTLTFRLPDGNDDYECYLDALYESGCSDALVGGCEGSILFDFIREAADIDDARNSAIRDVMIAIPGAILI